MKTIFSHIKNNYLVYILLILFGFLFLFRLDYNTLTSWDEAWYASIARSMTASGDIFHMRWNGIPYYDHPPLGFWMMAASYKVLGVNEFSTRLPSAILGILSSILIYCTAVKMFGRKELGFVAALIMGTCVWYVIRVRSGNLDGDFIFFYIATIYTSVLASKNFKWFPLTAAAFACLLLTKTLVGISAAPLILYLIFPQLLKIKKNIWYLVGGITMFLIVLLPWYYANYKAYPDFLEHHLFQVGSRGKSLNSYFHLSPQKPMFYIHMGIRKWYYLWLIATAFLVGSIGFDIYKRRFTNYTRMYIFLLLWNFVVLYPFLTSEKTELWHLIPVYLPIAFIIAAAFNRVISFKIVYLGIFIIVTILQVKTFYAEVIPVNKYVPDDVAISKDVAAYNKKIYLDDDFFPISVFYSNRRILPLYDLSNFGENPKIKTMVQLFQSDEKDFVVITRNWAIDNLKVAHIPYKILKKNNSFSIVTR